MNKPECPRVLYVENDEDTCLMVTVLLKFSDIETKCVKTIAEAWQTAQAEHFDLYLLDCQLPDGSGVDLCRRLRKYAPQTPILFYSANAFETDKQKGLAAGANAYLTKPYINDLSETILLTIGLSKKPGDKRCSQPVSAPPKSDGGQIDDAQIFRKILPLQMSRF